MAAFERISALGLQFAQDGAEERVYLDPFDVPDELVEAARVSMVFAGVGVLLYRRVPKLEVYLVRGHNVALTDEFIMANDLAPGETYEANMQDACTEFLGFTPSGAPNGELTTVSVQLSGIARSGKPGHGILVVTTYEMSEADIAAISPGTRADGTPSPKGIRYTGRWVDPHEVVKRPDGYIAPLVAVLEKFLEVMAAKPR